VNRYKKAFEVRWADLDPNRHLRHTAFNDYATQVRFRFLLENGFGPAEFSKYNCGPVMFREEALFFKEVEMNETITIDFHLAGMSEKGKRWKIIHNVFKEEGAKAALITVEGAWFDLSKRRLMDPPDKIVEIFHKLERTGDYQVIETNNDQPG